MESVPVQYKLRTWRRNQQLSQAEAAARMGVARRTWHQWERGSLVPGPANMIELVRLTEGAVQPNDFYRLPPQLGQQAA